MPHSGKNSEPKLHFLKQYSSSQLNKADLKAVMDPRVVEKTLQPRDLAGLLKAESKLGIRAVNINSSKKIKDHLKALDRQMQD